MSGVFTILIIGMIVYMLFSKNAGLGCCGGHRNHGPANFPRRDSARRVYPAADDKDDDIIDLGKEDYHVLSVEEKQGQK